LTPTPAAGARGRAAGDRPGGKGTPSDAPARPPPSPRLRPVRRATHTLAGAAAPGRCYAHEPSGAARGSHPCLDYYTGALFMDRGGYQQLLDAMAASPAAPEEVRHARGPRWRRALRRTFAGSRASAGGLGRRKRAPPPRRAQSSAMRAYFGISEDEDVYIAEVADMALAAPLPPGWSEADAPAGGAGGAAPPPGGGEPELQFRRAGGGPAGGGRAVIGRSRPRRRPGSFPPRSPPFAPAAPRPRRAPRAPRHPSPPPGRPPPNPAPQSRPPIPASPQGRARRAARGAPPRRILPGADPPPPARARAPQARRAKGGAGGGRDGRAAAAAERGGGCGARASELRRPGGGEGVGRANWDRSEAAASMWWGLHARHPPHPAALPPCTPQPSRPSGSRSRRPPRWRRPTRRPRRPRASTMRRRRCCCASGRRSYLARRRWPTARSSR
jgi:hypothetical protein